MRTETYELYGSSISIPRPENYKDCITLIKSDWYRRSGKVESFLMIALKSLRPFGFSLQFWLRLCQHKGWLYPFCRFMHLRACRKTQVLLSPSTRIGYGFYIGHCSCLIISERTIIGNNVNLSQFLNIGSNHRKTVIIGDNVYIGPQVCTVDEVKIGSNATIGAGAIVIKDVPENATVAGVPAKILNYNNPGRYVNRRWPLIVLLFLCTVFGGKASAQDTYKRLTNLPAVYIDIYDGSEIDSRLNYRSCRWVYVSEDGVESYDSVLIRRRGNAGPDYYKKPYKVKFPKKVQLLGPKGATAKKWALQSNGRDKLLFRNSLAGRVSRLCKMPFTPGSLFVDFFLNGNYQGNYEITDVVDIRKRRVDIEEMDTAITDPLTDISGGYLLEIDGYDDDWATYIKSPIFNNHIRIHSPEPEVINAQQIDYIYNHITRFEETLDKGEWPDPERRWKNYVDSATIMGWYLTNEICANTDIFWQIYFYKNRGDDKFYFGPIWDFDLSFNGDSRYGDEGDVTNLLFQENQFRSRYFYRWFDKLKVDDLWKEAQFHAFEKLYIEDKLDSVMLAYVDSISSYLRPSVDENYQLFGNISERTHYEIVLYDNYDRYVDDLREFIVQHNAYLYRRFKAILNNEEIGIIPVERSVPLPHDYRVVYDKKRGQLLFKGLDATDVGHLTASLCDLRGHVVMNINQSIQINVQSLPQGVYILKWSLYKNNRSLKFIVD